MAINLRLPDTVHEALRTTAELEHRSMNEVAIEAIVVYTSDRKSLRDALLDRIVVERHELFERLA